MSTTKVVYLWRGERHASGPMSRDEALDVLAKMRADRWQCWLEDVR